MDQTTSPASIANLPPELSEQILCYLIPQNHIFKLQSRMPIDPRNPPRHKGRGFPSHRGVPLFSTLDHGPSPPCSVLQTPNLNILTLLLIHPTLTPHVISLLYSNNIIYLPDMTTTRSFTTQISHLARSRIQRVQIDAHGPASYETHGCRDLYIWRGALDHDVAEVPRLFPALRELRLGGVGPSLMRYREFTYRGRRFCHALSEDLAWDAEVISLVARIVGVGRGDGHSEGGGGGDSVERENAFLGARVFCAKGMQWDRIPVGLMQLHGTRIVKSGVDVVLGSMEEVCDVAEAVREADRVREAMEKEGPQG